jgi:glucosyl-3-phosphoglycerate synthase
MRDWFARRTHRSSDFDARALARRKAELGLSVSVVLPARNEADTVTGVVKACGLLAGTLVDELVVMDGASEDDTAALAAEAGARVHADGAVLPEMGPPLGKGDALWRSLAVTSGDIVVFVDADIRNPDPRFVWGLLGPLLADPEVELVKAFYDRPVEIGGVQHATGGGRVTELMARPLLNLFWPALSGLIQPLSGEYAGRRSLLEAVPFFTGYGVELGLLVDTLARCGPDVIAQVDVGERVHTNQPLEALSQMAYGILQVAVQRLSEAERLDVTLDSPPVYRQFRRDGDASEITEETVQLCERPPMASLPR